MRHGGQILIDQLHIQGVERIFCVPGESYLAALDGLHGSRIETVVCRQEGGAAMMAEADGKLTGRPGIAFVTRGPGATNASAGVHVAFQDSTPMILFVGQVSRAQRDREAFQEVDYRRMFAPLAKWVAEIDLVERIPEYVSRAFQIARSGRPGPVVLALPEDMLATKADVPDAPRVNPAEAKATVEDVEVVATALQSAERPLVIVGGGVWSAETADSMAQFSERFQLPVAASFRRQDYIDNTHPSYVGDVGLGVNPALAKRIRDADLLLVLGARLGEVATSGYSLLDIPDTGKTLIHVHPDANELGRLYTPKLAINATPGSFLAAMRRVAAPTATPWEDVTRSMRADYLVWQQPQATPGAVKLEEVVRQLSDRLADDAFISNGAGNFSAWLHRYYRYRRFRTQLAPTSGSMGYGLPAAIAAKLRHPDRAAVCVTGDGDFQMTMQEFGTAVQSGANVVVVVCNNGMYGTIRMHQERHFPKRVSGTDLVNPDFAAFARTYGCFGETVTRTEDFAGALDRALAAGTPAVLELTIDRRALSPRLELEES